MKNFMKLTLVLMIVVALGVFAACDFSASDVEAIRFVKAPEASYKQYQEVEIKYFEVEVTYANNSTATFSLDNSLLTVQGVVDGKLDTSTPGQHTIIVTYQGIKCEFTYMVVAEGPATELTPVSQHENQEHRDFVAKLKSLEANKTETVTITLTQDYDFTGYEWEKFVANTPVVIKSEEGSTHTIKGITVTECNEDAIGFIAAASKSVTFENVNFDNTSITSNRKEVSVLVGFLNSGSKLYATNVKITNTYLYGLSCVAPLTGRTAGGQIVIDVKNVVVDGGTITSYNPVTVAFYDGEGDKIGGLFGQFQGKDSSTLDINNCTVKNITLSGTRDIGGIIAYINDVDAELTNNKVENVTFAASVSGGMLKEKGTRNVGGLIGTVQGADAEATKNIVLTDNEYTTNVNLYVNSDYDWSRTGKIIGGLRGKNVAFKITIDGVEYVMTYNDSHAYFTVGGNEINLKNCENIKASEDFEVYQAMQDEVMPYLNGEIIL